MEPSPYGLYRTLENLTIPDGYLGHWRYFKINRDGSYFITAGLYVYDPVWICIPDPYLDPNLPKPPPKPKVRPNMVARLEQFVMAEDGFFLLDPINNSPILKDPVWIIERDDSKFTLSIGDKQ